MYSIKKVLNDLVEQTYSGSMNLERYKKFYIEIINKNMKSKHGDYHEKTHHIRIFNLYRSDAAITATTIHELAHHIDYINRGTSDHSQSFYDVFQKLLYSALDMGLFTKEEFFKANRDANDTNKIKKMLIGYFPKKSDYMEHMQKISVKNGFDMKEELKVRKYSFNKIEKRWEKIIPERELSEEISFLESKKAEYEFTDATKIRLKHVSK